MQAFEAPMTVYRHVRAISEVAAGASHPHMGDGYVSTTCVPTSHASLVRLHVKTVSARESATYDIASADHACVPRVPTVREVSESLSIAVKPTIYLGQL